MTNEEEKKVQSAIDMLEGVLKNKDDSTPERVNDQENKPKRVAKLTPRTIESLRTKRKEKRLNKAYAKYNKKYQKMKEAAIEADAMRVAREEGQAVTNSELAVEYSIVASYDKKLAKMGAKLLKEEIKSVVASMDVSGKVVQAKRIKVPRFLLEKMGRLARAIEKSKVKKQEKKLVKEMTKNTKEYIKNSLDSALFKEDGTIREKIDADTIRNLGLKGGVSDTERRLDSLKGFISLDGKNSIFDKKDEEELEKDNKTNTDLPPAEPTPTTEKEEPKVNVDDLLKGLEPKKENSELGEKKVVEDKPKEEKVAPEVETPKPVNTDDVPTRRPVEVSEIITRNNEIRDLEAALKQIKDPEMKAALKEMIKTKKQEFDKLCRVGKEKKTEETKNDKNTLKPIEVAPKEESETKTKNIADKKTDFVDKTESVGSVSIKPSETTRVYQLATPTRTRVTLENIKRLQDKIAAGEERLAKLADEREELLARKKEALEFMARNTARLTEQAKAIDNEVKSYEAGNEVLKEDIKNIDGINSSFGKKK